VVASQRNKTLNKNKLFITINNNKEGNPAAGSSETGLKQKNALEPSSIKHKYSTFCIVMQHIVLLTVNHEQP